MKSIIAIALISISLLSCQVITHEERDTVLVGYESHEVLDRLAGISGVEVIGSLNELRVAVIRVSKDLNLRYLASIDGVDYVEKNVVYDPPDFERVSSKDLGDYQWGLFKVMDIDGDGKPNFEIWNTTDGSPVHVAIFDTPVDGTHPDLLGKIGLGYDTFTGTEIPSGTDYQDEDSRYDDHGTHVSGIIAALNDGKGITGVAPGVVVHPVVVFKPSFSGDHRYARGVLWALNHGVKVLSNSWGGGGYSYTIKRAIDLALSRGAVVVFSAGNSYNDSARYPAMYPGVIAVSASDVNEEIASFSSRGKHVDVAAPGKMVLSTVPGGGYEFWNGTSMAAPHVSAVAAMVLALHPDLRPSQVRKMIERSAVDICDPGYDEMSGYGRLSASAVFEEIPEPGVDLIVRALDSSGNPVGAVYLSLVKEGERGYYVKTELNGYGKFMEIDKGSYTLLVGGPDWLDPNSEVSRPVEGIHKRLELDLTDDSSITVVLKSDLELRTCPNSTVEVYLDGSPISSSIGVWNLPEDHESGLYEFRISGCSTAALNINGNTLELTLDSGRVCDEIGCEWRIF